jgi:hypothetical protein
MSRFCDDIETSFNKTSPSATGIAVEYGSKTAFTNYIGALGYFLNTTELLLLRITGDVRGALDRTVTAPVPMLILNPLVSWYRQVVTEFGLLIDISLVWTHTD